MSNNSFKRGRYNALHLSPRIRRVVDVLEANGFLDRVKGSNNRTPGQNGRGNHTTRIKPTAKLEELFSNLTLEREDITFHKDEEVIILRDKDEDDPKAKKIDYVDNDETIRMRAEVRAYNKMMLEYFVDVASLEQPFYERTYKDNDCRDQVQQIWITQENKFTRRTFSRGRFDLNGRWNGGFWQNLPKVLRRHIWIDGDQTDEWDYSGLHPNILALQMGHEFSGDQYQLDKQVVKSIRLADQRAVVKSLVLYAINAKNLDACYRAFQTRHPGYKKRDLKLLLEAYIDQHPFMADAIGSDKGIELMYLDSQIAAHVIREFVDLRIPILPIHDSFIARLEDIPFLEKAMSAACYTILGQDLIKTSRQWEERSYPTGHLNQYTSPSDKHQPLERLVEDEDRPSFRTIEAYKERWHAWSISHPEAYSPDLVDTYLGELVERD